MWPKGALSKISKWRKIRAILPRKENAAKPPCFRTFLAVLLVLEFHHWFKKYLLSVYYVPSRILGLDTQLEQTVVPALMNYAF